MSDNKISQLDSFIKDTVNNKMDEMDSFIQVSNFKSYVEEGHKMKEPEELFKNVLIENEVTILFGDTGLGKSTLAMQIAIEVARQYSVLYVNFELSKLQISKRYSDTNSIPEKLKIADIDYTKMHDVTDQNMILDEIERVALYHEARVIIIDNFTNLCMNAKDGNEAGNIMLKLLSLRMTHDWSMLILAHVPKRKPSDALTLNDLAGSKNLSNYADNVVGINKSKLGINKRYIIQLKFRSRPIILDNSNVQELSMVNNDGSLHFDFGECMDERKHLPRSRDEKAELEKEIVEELKKPNGLSYRDIADKLGTSLGTVQRVAKSNNLNRKSEK